MAARRFNPDVSDRAVLYAAARVIEREMRMLRECHSLKGRWCLATEIDHSAKAEYKSNMALVRELRARARVAD